MKRKSKKIISKIKKDLGAFLSSEEGKILEKNIIQTAAVLGIAGIGVLNLKAEDVVIRTNALENHYSGGVWEGRHLSNINHTHGSGTHSSGTHSSGTHSSASHSSGTHSSGPASECQCYYDTYIGPNPPDNFYVHHESCKPLPCPPTGHINVWIPV
ncbi:MAG TPA: hypothetical protein VMW66_03130 [Elusimicrobiales bacterium]|nr:hypothetical protein [Elusimicrobiales bacterium]